MDANKRLAPIWLIGGGNMGEAMLRGWLADGMPAERFCVIDPRTPAMPAGVAVWASPPVDADAPGVIVLAVKPQLLDMVVPGLLPFVDRAAILLSILAGVELASLARRFEKCPSIVRVMPNMGVAIGKGVMALHADSRISKEARADLVELARPLGLVEWVAHEEQFDAVTSICGCGPAFLYRLIDAMAAGGTAQGLPADQAARLALATVEGAASLVAACGDSPAALADRVASPGGSTRAGLDVLDAGGVLLRLLAKTIEASTQRNRELASASR